MSYAFPPGRLPLAADYYATMPLWGPPGLSCGCSGLRGLGTEDPNQGGSAGTSGEASGENLEGEGSDAWYVVGGFAGVFLGLVGGIAFGMMAYPPPQKPLPRRAY